MDGRPYHRSKAAFSNFSRRSCGWGIEILDILKHDSYRYFSLNKEIER